MSKRGGFPGNFGGMNLNNLMREAKKMQADIEKSQEELDYEKKHNVHIAVFPHRHPDKNFVKEYNKAWKELSTFEKKMFNYQNKCKNELFDLLKKYYWDLWD